MGYPKTTTIGYPGATEQPVKYVWDTRSGWQTIRRWRGLYPAIVQLFSQLQQQGYNFSMDGGPVHYTCTATIGYSYSSGALQDNPVDVWELGSTRAEKDLLQADVPIINGLSAGDKALIRDNYLSPPSPAPGFGSPNAATVYAFMVEGFTGIPINAPTLRHTQTVSAGNQAVQAAVNGNNTLWLLNTINPPASLNINLSSLGTAGKTGYVYGWYQDFPNARVAAFNKTQIITEWTYGLFPVAVFGNPS